MAQDQNRNSNSSPQLPHYSGASDADNIRSCISVVCSQLSAPGTSTSDPEATLDVYFGVLSAFSAETVRLCCMAALNGLIGDSDGRFRPSVAQMATWCREKPMRDNAKPPGHAAAETKRLYLDPPREADKLTLEQRQAITAKYRTMYPLEGDARKHGAADARDVKERAAQAKIAAEKALVETDWQQPVRFSENAIKALREQDQERAGR